MQGIYTIKIFLLLIMPLLFIQSKEIFGGSQDDMGVK